jgi:hypothetical protein
MNDSEIKEIEDNLQLYDKETQNYEKILELPDKDRKTKINECNRILRKIKSNILICKRRNETENADNPIIKNGNKKILEKYEAELKKKEALQKELSRPINKNTTKNENENEEIDPENLKTTQDILGTAKKYQDESIEALRRTERMMATTEETGQEISITIQKQTELIIEIDKEADTIQANINRAKKEVSYFFRQLSGDKCCIMLLVLLVLAIVCLVFYMVYKRNNG